MTNQGISTHTRKLLWSRAGERCAFPGCEQPLVEATPNNAEGTVIGVECHIVAQREGANLARTVSSLSPEERRRYQDLIDHRHAFKNLVLMCGSHSTLIDDRAQGFLVADVLEMKLAHDEEVSRERREARARRTGDAEPELQAPPLRLLVIEDVPAWQRKAIRQLAENEPGALSWLESEVGDPMSADPDKVVDLIDRWPRRLMEGSRDLLYAVVRLAESAGRWSAASTVWERLADRNDDLRVDHLVRAAVDAGIGGDSQRHDGLLQQAEDEDPDSPRLKLEQLDDRQPPEEQLEQLDGLYSDNAPLASLIAAHRARAAMMLPDLEAAERHLEEARELEPDSLQVRSMQVNLEVQRARLALREDRPSSLADARAATVEALELRDTMIEMGRWEESGRLLMLAADVHAVLRDPASAERLLETARPEEIAAPDGAHVLGDAALRAGSDRLALHFIEDADPTDEATRRIRASAQASDPQHRVRALAELRDLALGGGPDADLAAFARLAECVERPRADWDEEVAAVLENSRHKRELMGLRVMAAAGAGDLIRAGELANDLPDEPWAAELRLRVAGVRGHYPTLEAAAQAFLGFSPDASGRLLAGNAFAQADRLDRAEEVLRAVAHDLNAPPMVRSDAFASLLRTLADRDEWQTAEREWDEWQQLSWSALERPEDRVSAWQVRIVHHQRRP